MSRGNIGPLGRGVTGCVEEDRRRMVVTGDEDGENKIVKKCLVDCKFFRIFANSKAARK